MGDRFSALLMSLMALRLALVDQNPFWPCLCMSFGKFSYCIYLSGEVSAGKSSLLNLLLGTDLFPTSLLSCTSVLCELKHSDRKYAIAFPCNTSKHQHIIDLSGSDPASCLAKYVHQKDDRQNQFTWDKVSVYWPFPLLKVCHL